MPEAETARWARAAVRTWLQHCIEAVAMRLESDAKALRRWRV
jgi:hypothetical protein